MEKNSTEPRVEWMLKSQIGIVSKIYQKCFGCPPPPNIFEGQTERLFLFKVIVYYKDKIAFEKAERKIGELANLSRKHYSRDEINNLHEEYSKLMLEAKLVILGFSIFDFDKPKKRNTIVKIGVTPEDTANAGRILLDHLVMRAKEKNWELVIASDAIPETMRFLFPTEKLSPTETEEISLLSF
ncbi:MAG: hypothetical protein Q8O66_00455 [bacterium]|nr:hypothetical protein [bacterium]